MVCSYGSKIFQFFAYGIRIRAKDYQKSGDARNRTEVVSDRAAHITTTKRTNHYTTSPYITVVDFIINNIFQKIRLGKQHPIPFRHSIVRSSGNSLQSISKSLFPGLTLHCGFPISTYTCSQTSMSLFSAPSSLLRKGMSDVP